MTWEIQILDWLQTFHSPAGDALMKGITFLGDGGIIWILLTVILLAVPRTRKAGAVLGTALLLDLILCNGLLKNLVARMRPYEVNEKVQLLIRAPGDYSFPSGHTAASFASVSALYFAGARRLWKPALGLAVLIAFSRLYLYVHFPTDILGGIAVGILCGYLGYRLIEMAVEKRKKFSQSS